MMKVKIINESAYPAPSYATEYSAGMDLKADIEAPVTLGPLQRAMVREQVLADFQGGLLR